jgi:hypothetical protein
MSYAAIHLGLRASGTAPLSVCFGSRTREANKGMLMKALSLLKVSVIFIAYVLLGCIASFAVFAGFPFAMAFAGAFLVVTISPMAGVTPSENLYYGTAFVFLMATETSLLYFNYRWRFMTKMSDKARVCLGIAR